MPETINIMEYMPYVWTFILILSVLVEAATASLTAIWFMPAGFVSLLLSVFELPLWLQITSYVVLGIAALILSRTVFRKYIGNAGAVATNANRIIGQTAIVVTEIDNEQSQGEVKVLGQHWTARSEDGERIPAGSHVTAVRIDGVKLIVKKKTN